MEKRIFTCAMFFKMFVKYRTINLKCIVTIFGKADLDCSLQKPLTILHNAGDFFLLQKNRQLDCGF